MAIDKKDFVLKLIELGFEKDHLAHEAALEELEFQLNAPMFACLVGIVLSHQSVDPKNYTLQTLRDDCLCHNVNKLIEYLLAGNILIGKKGCGDLVTTGLIGQCIDEGSIWLAEELISANPKAAAGISQEQLNVLILASTPRTGNLNPATLLALAAIANANPAFADAAYQTCRSNFCDIDDRFDNLSLNAQINAFRIFGRHRVMQSEIRRGAERIRLSQLPGHPAP